VGFVACVGLVWIQGARRIDQRRYRGQMRAIQKFGRGARGFFTSIQLF
jgi:hypothetical protein